MIFNFLNKIISVFLALILILGLFPLDLQAQQNPFVSGEVKGFNKSVFDSHFSKADRELNPERWMTEARLGINQAIYAWELIAGSLYENPLQLEEAKKTLEQWSDEELEKRFSKWLVGRFFGKAADEAHINLSLFFSETQKNYLWHLDEEGNIIFDEKTGNPLVIRPNEEGREFSLDLLKWRNETDDLIITAGNSFNNTMIALYPELLAYIPHELRESMNAVIIEAVNVKNNIIRLEFENIAAREERIFTSRRTRDIWSLRNKSENESARIFTERLILETEESCKKGIDELNIRIEQAAAGTGDLAILGEEWLRLYKEQFDRGLKAWEDAEERFFIRRIEWEQDSFRLFLDGEEIWHTAFLQFEEERQKWELSAKELFEHGEILFKNISDDFEKTITEAKKEFELNMAIRIGEGTTKTKALIDMYLLCASTAVTSLENISFWQNQYGKNEKDPKESDFLDWLLGEMINLWEQAEENYINTARNVQEINLLNLLKEKSESPDETFRVPIIWYNDYPSEIYFYNGRKITENDYLQYKNRIYRNHTIYFQIQDIIAGEMDLYEQISFAKSINFNYLSRFQFEALIEIQSSYIMYHSYLEKALDVRDKILNNYGELFGTGALKDILSSDVSSEDFCLDEYQIAIIRAKALVLYWERKTEINKAILAYAGELSAGRMTEAEGIRAWEDAKAAYNFSLSVYENELNKLNDIGIDFQKQQAVLNSLTLQMQKEEENLKLLNSEYASFISLSINSRENYYLSEFNTRYNYLVNEYKYNLLKGDDSSYRNILLYGMLWDIAEQKEMIENILHLLETRDDLSEEEIAALNNEYLLLNPEKQKEIWQNTCNSLAALFNSYGFESGTYLLPDVQRISEAILGKPGDFVQNTVNFLMDFDECFYIIPQWLDYEIENWKDAIIEYIAAYSFSTGKIPVKSIAELSTLYEQYLLEYTVLYQFASMLDYTDIIEAELMNSELKDKINKLIMLDYMYKITESWEIINFYSAIGNEKHWRQYLSDEYIINKDFSLAMSLTWTEGIIADALYYASYYTNRVNDSLDLISQKDQYIRNENSGHFFNLYYKELSKNIMAFNSLRILSNEIPNFVKAYELSRMSPEETKNQLLFLEESLKTQENKFNLLWENYHLEAEKFMDIGSLYDSQYTILKKAHDNADEKRFLYEKQDAIQRWASTPYIHADSVDLENSNVKLQRAQTVLNVLSDLYNSENTRSHDNPEYQILYSAYEESFNRKLKALEAIELISSEYMYELNNNEKLFMEYQNSLNRLGYIDSSLVNLITEKNGRLVFIKNESNPNGIEELFTTTSLPEGERFNITQYDDALRGLSQRMSGYFTDRSKFQQWSYARNHLLLTLMRSGSDYSFLNKYYSAQGQMAEGGSVASILIMTERKGKKDTIYSEIGGRSLFVDAEILFKNEWDRLSAEEKADLEFYVILTLTTGNDYFSGFSMYYTHDVYMHALNFAYEQYNYARKKAKEIHTLWFYNEMKDVNYIAYSNVQPAATETSRLVNEWFLGLQENLNSINNLFAAYTASCQKLDALEGEKTDDLPIEWNDLNTALSKTKMKDEDISTIKSYWEEMLEESAGKVYKNIPEALGALLQWTSVKENDSKNNLENRWLSDLQKQKLNEQLFQEAIDAYISGTGSIETLKTAAENTYGSNIAAWKNHYNNMFDTLSNNLSKYLDMNFNFISEFNTLGNEILLLTAKTIESRYMAELSARETEWNQMLKDITEKYLEWQNSAAIILENGRTDWITGIQKMEDAYKQWNVNFQDEYERVNSQWAQAYLAGLEDKEKWLEQAANAVNQASSDSFLSLVGTEGERLSRFMDIRDPLGIRDAVPEAQTLMSELLQSSGIVNMSGAFNSLNSYSGIASPLVRRGMGGTSTWDAALVKSAASDLARKTNAEIANNESRKVAYSARMSVDEAIKGLAANVDNANQGFRASMDNLFIFNGLWRRSGNNYSKEIIKGSTLFTPVVTEAVTITGYANYILEPVILQTNLDENYLLSLNSIAIMDLLENVYAEVSSIAGKIFGIGEAPVKINRSGVTREQSAGKFGAHIGYDPATKQSDSEIEKRRDLFHDEGAGELGRLVSDYIYWTFIDQKGNAELSLPPWEKRMWNDDGSWFTAPSLKVTGQIVGAVAATIVSVVATPFTGGASLGVAVGMALLVAGINSTNDLIFGALDAAYGYKTLDEAAFQWGKTSLINVSTSMVSGVFGGFASAGTGVLSQGLTATAVNTVNTASGAIGAVVTQTLSTGMQSIISGMATSLLSGVTYSNADGFGFSNDIAKASMKNMWMGSLTSMAGTFTTSSLGAINSGIKMEKLTGFNKMNQTDLQKLNSLAGSLASQGVNYALGNDFSLNIFNLSMLTNQKINVGLLELNIGRDGPTLNFGTGGANVSIDNLHASFRGAQVWNVNTRISGYIRNEGKEGGNGFDSAITLRAQYGYGDSVQMGQLWDILRGNTLIDTGSEGEYAAQTTIDDNGKRVINLANYQQGMSMEEQFRLAVIFGHEAYRDGVSVGGIDASGNTVTRESNFSELRDASIARLSMGDRINSEHDWFYNQFEGLAFERLLLGVAKETGDYSLFNDYLELAYNNDGDYLWLSTNNGNDYQNDYRTIPLLNSALTEESAKLINERRLADAFSRYTISKGIQGSAASYNALYEGFKSNEDLQKEWGYRDVSVGSIADYGCMFMSIKYGLESIIDAKVDTMLLHNFIIKNNHIVTGTDNWLSNELMAKIMTEYSGGQFIVELYEVYNPKLSDDQLKAFDKLKYNVYNELPSFEQFKTIEASPEEFLAHFRIQNPANNNAIIHSITLSGINYQETDGHATGIKSLNVANPLRPTNHYNTKTVYEMDAIVRMDLFRVIRNNQ